MIIDRASVTHPENGTVKVAMHDDGKLIVSSNQRGAWVCTQLYLRGSLRVILEKTEGPVEDE